MSEPAAAVLVVTHGRAGVDMVAALRGLVGTEATADFEALAVEPGEDRKSTEGRVAEAVARVDRGAGVLVLCDLHGATPANCAVELKHHGLSVEVLCGVSLPMLIKLATLDRRSRSLATLAHEAAETAIRSIRLGEGGEP